MQDTKRTKKGLFDHKSKDRTGGRIARDLYKASMVKGGSRARENMEAKAQGWRDICIRLLLARQRNIEAYAA